MRLFFWDYEDSMKKKKPNVIFLTQDGDQEVGYNDTGYPTETTGWRWTSLARREQVTYGGPEFGWQNENERFDARQTDPRLAP